MEAKTYMTRRETANLLRVSVRTVDRLCQTGELESFTVGRRRLFRRAQIEKLCHITGGETNASGTGREDGN